MERRSDREGRMRSPIQWIEFLGVLRERMGNAHCGVKPVACIWWGFEINGVEVLASEQDKMKQNADAME